MTVTIEAVKVAGAVLSQSSVGLGAASRPLGLAALTTWLLDAGSGAYMLGTWIHRGGLRRQRASGDRLGSAIVFSHFGMASTGLLIWASYLATQWAPLGWLAIGLLMVVIGLGISTVTLWTPFPAHRAADAGGATGMFAEPSADALSRAVTDEQLTRALTDEVLLAKMVDEVLARAPEDELRAARKPRAYLATLIPAGHGIAAITTILLAALTAVSAAR
jgi:manganese efflux pump family protein